MHDVTTAVLADCRSVCILADPFKEFGTISEIQNHDYPELWYKEICYKDT